MVPRMNLGCPVHLCLVGWVSQVLLEKSKSSIVQIDQRCKPTSHWFEMVDLVGIHFQLKRLINSQRVLLTAHPGQTCVLYVLRCPNYRRSPKMSKWRKKIRCMHGEAGTQLGDQHLMSRWLENVIEVFQFALFLLCYKYHCFLVAIVL